MLESTWQSQENISSKKYYFIVSLQFFWGLEIEKLNVKELQVANGFKYAKMLQEESGLK